LIPLFFFYGYAWCDDGMHGMQVSLAARQLMYRLLHRDPANRLGSYEGASEIKQHTFFRGINWALVRTVVPPKLEVEDATAATVSHMDMF